VGVLATRELTTRRMRTTTLMARENLSKVTVRSSIVKALIEPEWRRCLSQKPLALAVV
jgi:hypothetical protein